MIDAGVISKSSARYDRQFRNSPTISRLFARGCAVRASLPRALLHNVGVIAPKIAAADYNATATVTRATLRNVFARYRVSIIAAAKLIGARKIGSGSAVVDTATAV